MSPHARLYTGPEIGAFSKAVQPQFTPATLSALLLFELDKRLIDYSLADDFRKMTFDVLTAANREGWLADLICKAAAEYPTSAPLAEAAQRAQLALPPPSPVLPFSAAQGSALEKIVSQQSRFADIDSFLARFQKVRDAVCRVAAPGGGGTGFLIAPDLVITNYHVLKKVLEGPGSLGAVECIFGHRRDIETGAINPGETFQVDPRWAPIFRRYSAGDIADPPTEPHKTELDYAIIKLTTPATHGFRECLRLAGAEAAAEGVPAFILQHPQPPGSVKQLPLQLAIGKIITSPWPLVRTRHNASTLPGSSGSPCCNSDLELIALHHLGDPASGLPQYNQAIPITGIVADLAGQAGELSKRGVAPFWI